MPEIQTGPCTTTPSSTTCIMAYPRTVRIVPGLLRGFLGIQHGTSLVLSALGAGAMRKLLLVAVRALRNPGLGQEIVGTTVGAAAR